MGLREEKKQQQRQAIVDTALALFRDRGFSRPADGERGQTRSRSWRKARLVSNSRAESPPRREEKDSRAGAGTPAARASS